MKKLDLDLLAEFADDTARNFTNAQLVNGSLMALSMVSMIDGARQLNFDAMREMLQEDCDTVRSSPGADEERATCLATAVVLSLSYLRREEAVIYDCLMRGIKSIDQANT